MENVVGENEDYGEYKVKREQLIELVNLCREVRDGVETIEGDVSAGWSSTGDGRLVKRTRPGVVVACPGYAAKLLPTPSLCLFGPTDYDEYYRESLKYTVETLAPLLDDREMGVEFYYRFD